MILRILRAVCIPLNGIYHASIVRKPPITRLPLWRMRPFDELIEITAHTHLTVADFVWFCHSWHRCIIRGAHEILTKCVEAVMNMPGMDLWRETSLIVDKGLSHRFLNTIRFVTIPHGTLVNVQDNVAHGRLLNSMFLSISHPMESGKRRSEDRGLSPSHRTKPQREDLYQDLPRVCQK